LRVPERVKGWLRARVALEVVRVMAVGVRVPTVRLTAELAGRRCRRRRLLVGVDAPRGFAAGEGVGAVGGGGGVLAALQWPEGSVLPSVMDLPERGVLLALRVPERVKGWLRARVALEW